MLPPPVRGLSHPREHKGSHLHCGFEAPIVSPWQGLCRWSCHSLQEDKGMCKEARGACRGKIFSPFWELFPLGTQGEWLMGVG